MGVWRMESHGYNAAAEIPAMADLAMFVGDLVPAVLHLVERRAVKDGKTSRFVVPVLDLLVSKARLVELASRGGAPVATTQYPHHLLHRGSEVGWGERGVRTILLKQHDTLLRWGGVPLTRGRPEPPPLPISYQLTISMFVRCG
jgi:hypothetical protein